MSNKSENKTKYICIEHNTECNNIYEEHSFNMSSGKWEPSKTKGFCKQCNDNVYVKKKK